jgi:uncharacterized membrane protein YhfC
MNSQDGPSANLVHAKRVLNHAGREPFFAIMLHERFSLAATLFQANRLAHAVTQEV